MSNQEDTLFNALPTSDESSAGVSDVPTSATPMCRSSKENTPQSSYNGDEENEGPATSFQGVIPPQLQKGWGLLTTWVTQSANVVSGQAAQFVNSDMVKDLSKKASNGAAAGLEAAAPYWEATKQHTIAITDQALPVIQDVSHKVAETVSEGWQSFSHAASSFTAVATGGETDEAPAPAPSAFHA